MGYAPPSLVTSRRASRWSGVQKWIFHILLTRIQTMYILTSLDEVVESFASYTGAHPVGQIDVVVRPLRAWNDGVSYDSVEKFHTYLARR